MEVDAEMKITRMRDCEGEDIFSKFDAKCEKGGCSAKLWPVGRQGEFRCFISEMRKADCRGQIQHEEKRCDQTWFSFEPYVVNGWPMDLVRIFDGRLMHNPLGINAERISMEDK